MLKSKKRSTALIVALTLILCIAAGGTLAYLIDKTDEVENTFAPTEVTTSISETITAQNEKEHVVINNTGTTDAWIRAQIIINWKDANGNVYGTSEPVTGSGNQLTDDYIISYNLNENGWTQGSDGFYYYKGIVAPGASTDVLINSCAPVTGKAPEGYYLSVEIIASAIQADGESLTEETVKNVPGANVGDSPVEIAWGVTLDDDTKAISK